MLFACFQSSQHKLHKEHEYFRLAILQIGIKKNAIPLHINKQPNSIESNNKIMLLINSQSNSIDFFEKGKNVNVQNGKNQIQTIEQVRQLK